MSKLIGVLFDVSGSMEYPFKNLSNKKYSIKAKSNSLLSILTNISKNFKIDLFTLLFGSKPTEISDFLLLLKLINSFLKDLQLDDSNPKKRFIELMSRYGPQKLEKYIYNKYGPSDKLMSFICELIKKNDKLELKIYNNLPQQAKESRLIYSTLSYGYNNITHVFQKMNSIDLEIIKQIKDNFNFCIEDIFSQIFKKMEEDNDFKNQNYTLIRSDNLDIIIKEIYFKHLENHLKYSVYIKIIVVTDGDPTNYVIQESEKNDVYIIGCFISIGQYSKNTFYDDNSFNIQNQGAKTLFKMSSKITCDNPIYRFFLIKNWNFTSSGYCRLFIALNNQETINEFITLINESLDYKGASLNGLVDVIGSSSINSYVNSYSNNLFLSKNQIFGTCWANACAACIHFANMRVLGRKQISFEDLRKHIIINYSLEDKDGNNISNITKKIYDDYKITVKQVDENEAKIAVMKGRPCIASFYLSGKQWANFSEFFYDDINKYKYLDSNFINKDDYPKIYYDGPKSVGHAVVLIENKNEGMTFLNSWGIGFGDFGKFRIKNGDVLTDGNNNNKIKFYDVYWTLNDLSYDEKKYYKENHEIVISNTLSFIMGSKQKIDELMNKNIICNKCNNYSKAINYKGNFLLVKCPLCNSIYENNNIDLKKCLYLREILPNEENYHLDNSELRNKIKEEIKIYRIKSENTQKINDFKKSVNCIIILSDNRLCACSSDYSIKIYNYNKIDVNFQF